jgi:hypothetical protein
MPDLFSDPGYGVLSTSVLSTSNCGNPALRLFGFAEVTPEGYGIGCVATRRNLYFLTSSELTRYERAFSYIIKESGLSICAASKHLQTRRFLDTLQAVLLDLQRMIVQLYVEANKSPKTVATPVIPSLTRIASEAGLTNGGSAAKKSTVLVKGGRRLNGLDEIDEAELLQAAAEETLDGYGYFELPVEETRRERHKRIGASSDVVDVVLKLWKLIPSTRRPVRYRPSDARLQLGPSFPALFPSQPLLVEVSLSGLLSLCICLLYASAPWREGSGLACARAADASSQRLCKNRPEDVMRKVIRELRTGREESV